MRKATGTNLVMSTSLEKLRALSLVFATLRIEYATQLVKISEENASLTLFYFLFSGALELLLLQVFWCAKNGYQEMLLLTGNSPLGSVPKQSKEP